LIYCSVQILTLYGIAKFIFGLERRKKIGYGTSEKLKEWIYLLENVERLGSSWMWALVRMDN
jgi:hypothetical protein